MQEGRLQEGVDLMVMVHARSYALSSNLPASFVVLDLSPVIGTGPKRSIAGW